MRYVNCHINILRHLTRVKINKKRERKKNGICPFLRFMWEFVSLISQIDVREKVMHVFKQNMGAAVK